MKLTNVLLLLIFSVLACFLGVALFAPSRPASIEYTPGEDLLFFCSRQLEPEPAGPVQPWYKGSYELHSFAGCFPVMDSVIRRSTDRFCLPLSPMSKIAIRHVVTYLQQHPERLHEEAETLALDGLLAGFPCRALPSYSARGNTN